jgi:hypothetical protein
MIKVGNKIRQRLEFHESGPQLRVCDEDESTFSQSAATVATASEPATDETGATSSARKPFNCQICAKTLLLTPIEALRHKKSCGP